MSVTDKPPTFNTLDEVPPEVNDCWVGGVLHHRCGSGRRYQTKSAVPPCGELKPHGKPHYHHNNLYPANAAGDTYALTCAECYNRDKRAKKAAKTEYRAETPRDRQVAVFASTPKVETEVGAVQLGVAPDGKQWFPVRPMLRLTRFDTEAGLYNAIEDDLLLKPVVCYAEQLGTDGKRYEMLHLPWEHWPGFVHKFGNASTLPLQQAVHRVIARAFGSTQEEVGRNARAAMSGATPRPRQAISDVLRGHLHFVRDLGRLIEKAEAEERERERVKSETAVALLRAEEQEAEAARIMTEAREARHRAQAADKAAEERLQSARSQVEALIAQADELSGEEVQHVYFFGPADYASRMFVDGKVGDTRNIPQRRKQLRAGNPANDMIISRPCDDGEECAVIILTYLCDQGAQKVGNDHFRNAPGTAVARVMTTLEGMEYVLPDALAAQLNHRSAA